MHRYEMPRRLMLRVFAGSMAVAILSLVGMECVWLWFFFDGLLLTKPGIEVLVLQVVVILIGLMTLGVDIGVYMKELRKKR